jgi:hypothetical protein
MTLRSPLAGPGERISKELTVREEYPLNERTPWSSASDRAGRAVVLDRGSAIREPHAVDSYGRG